MNKVYVVNEPLRFASGVPERSIDLEPARQFGELVHLLPAGRPPADPTPSVKLLRERLKGYTPDDYLLPVGHPAFIGVATAIAADQSGGIVKFLIWNQRTSSYSPMTVETWE